MDVRNTTQTASVTRGVATATIVVDYGEHPPRIMFYVRTPRWRKREELVPQRFGDSVWWWLLARRGIVASGRAEWRADTSVASIGSLDVAGDEGADVAVAAALVRLAARRRWRVYRRREQQAEIDGEALRETIRQEMTR